MIRSIIPHQNVMKLLGFTENPFSIVMKVYKLSLKDFIAFINSKGDIISYYMEDVTGAINFMDQTVSRLTDNQNLVIAQKYKIALDIALGMNRKTFC